MSQIVVIEDDRSLQNFLNERLAAAGFQVVCANNGRIGLWTIQQCQPDVVLSDIDMPEMDGYERVHYPLSLSLYPLSFSQGKQASQGKQTHFLFRKASHIEQLARPGVRTGSTVAHQSQTSLPPVFPAGPSHVAQEQGTPYD